MLPGSAANVLLRLAVRARRRGSVLYWGQLERENERIDDITARLEAMDAENGGRILASVTVYREVQQLKAPVTAAPAAKSIYVCATTRLPKRTFVVVDDAVTETSQNFETILGRLKSMYAVRQAVRIEVRTQRSPGADARSR